MVFDFGRSLGHRVALRTCMVIKDDYYLSVTSNGSRFAISQTNCFGNRIAINYVKWIGKLLYGGTENKNKTTDKNMAMVFLYQNVIW